MNVGMRIKNLNLMKMGRKKEIINGNTNQKSKILPKSDSLSFIIFVLPLKGGKLLVKFTEMSSHI